MGFLIPFTIEFYRVYNQYYLMSTGFQTDKERISAINTASDKFALIIINLIKGNKKRAKKTALKAIKESPGNGLNICMQDAIENLATEQAIKSSIINSPSIFPGIGTVISFLLLGTESFLVLEQGVKIASILLIMNGFNPDDKEFEEQIIRIIGEAYGLADMDEAADSRTITKEYITRIAPPKYISKGFNKALSKFFPTKNRILKLMPLLGVVYAALEGYAMTVKVGQATVKYIKGL